METIFQFSQDFCDMESFGMYVKTNCIEIKFLGF